MTEKSPWFPISTAPKPLKKLLIDLLVFGGTWSYRVTDAWWSDGWKIKARWPRGSRDAFPSHHFATHWMHRPPDPPTLETGQ